MRASKATKVAAQPPMPVASRPSQVDTAAVARGAWRGFAVLLLGGLAAPLVQTATPAIGSVWLSVVAVVAFMVAAWQPGLSRDPRWSGALAAVGAYVVVAPLVVLHPDGRSLTQMGTTLLAACITGAVTGQVRSNAARSAS